MKPAEVVAAGFVLARERVGDRKGSRAVSRPDEDAVTLAVHACGQAMADGPEPSALILATTSPPYDEGGSTQPIAEILGLPENLLAFELTAGPRDGLVAVRLAAALTSEVGPVLVVAAHADRHDPTTGDGAVALLIAGNSPGSIATLTPHGSHSEELRDIWRLGRSAGRMVADKSFIDTIGTTDLGRRAAADSLLLGLPTMVVGPDARAAGKLESELGGPGDSVVRRGGLLGSAHPLTRALVDTTGPANLIALSSGQAESAGMVPGPGLTELRVRMESELNGGDPVDSVSKDEVPADFDPYSSVPRAWRERKDDFRLERFLPPGSPAPGRRNPTGRVVTMTRDSVYPGTEPVSMAAVDLDGGGRFFGQVASGQGVGIGEEIVLVPRRLHAGGGMVQWFWKVAPCR